MKHICPKCNFEYTGELDTCPNCGFQIEKIQTENLKETDDDFSVDQEKDLPDVSKTESEKDSPELVNDDIQWSEYKEMPIGSVAELLNESLDEPEEAAGEESTSVKKFAGDSEKNDESQQSDDEEIFSKKTNSSETEPSDNWILQQYMKEHRQETSGEEKDSSVLEKESETEKTDEEETAALSETKEYQKDSEEPSLLEKIEKTELSANEDQGAVPSEDSSEEEDASTFHSHEPLNLFVLDDEEGTQENSEFTKFDDPNLAPLPSEEEKPAEEYTSSSDFKKALLKEESTRKEESFQPEVEEKPEPEIKKTTRPKAKSSRKWLYIGAAAAVLLVGGTAAFAYHQQQETAKKEATAQSSQEAADAAAVKKLQGDLDDFYTDDSHTFVKADKISDSLVKLKSEIDKYKDEAGYADLESTYDDLTKKISLINQVNEIYAAPVIVGDALAENPLLKADKEITLEDQSGDDGFSTLINQSLAEAKSQYTALQTAKAKVATVYTDGNVMENIDRTTYDDAIAAVSAVKNQELVANLKTELQQVDTSLTEAEKAAEAEQNAANAAAESAASGGNYSVGGGGALNGFSMNRTGDPIVNSSAADIADSGNSAWAWEGDVKETVIQKCIDRGYITADNYVLEPAVIVDGNGFYNLYKVGDTRTYLVTINCKTGWFKGNGSGGPNTRVDN